MGKLSKESIHKRPRLCIYEALSNAWFGQLDEAEVLLAEDNELNIQLIKISLKKLCNIDSTTNAKDAVKMAKTKIYDAILMDINLGEGMDGLQAVKEIRRIPGYNKIPIVAVTGYALKGDKELMLDGGCSDYIPKPFDRETIENMMKKVLFKN